MSVSYERRTGEGDAATAVIRIERPDKSNAVDPQTDALMCEAWARAERDDAVRCIVLTGAGHQAFCAGGDLERLLPWLRERAAADADDGTFCGLTRAYPTRKPIIAAVNGMAFGGGLELALAADVRIASEKAWFALPEVKVGFIAGAGGTARLPRAIPLAIAAEMLLTGDPIDAATALRAGLVSRVVPPGELMDTALGLARRIAANAPLAVERTLDLLRRSRSTTLEDALDGERASFLALLGTDDAREGMSAFVEKRRPSYGGR